MSYVEYVTSKKLNNLYLCKGKDMGRNAWYYIKIDNLIKPIFLHDYSAAKKMIDLSKYGIIIHSGWGEEPPENIKLEMESA